jgi:hypothetical protein
MNTATNNEVRILCSNSRVEQQRGRQEERRYFGREGLRCPRTSPAAPKAHLDVASSYLALKITYSDAAKIPGMTKDQTTVATTLAPPDEVTPGKKKSSDGSQLHPSRNSRTTRATTDGHGTGNHSRMLGVWMPCIVALSLADGNRLTSFSHAGKSFSPLARLQRIPPLSGPQTHRLGLIWVGGLVKRENRHSPG